MNFQFPRTPEEADYRSSMKSRMILPTRQTTLVTIARETQQKANAANMFPRFSAYGEYAPFVRLLL
jgi:hypothetical protein